MRYDKTWFVGLWLLALSMATAAPPPFSELTESVRLASLTEETVQAVEPLIIGGIYGDEMLVSAIEIDALMPKTLEVYFDQWNAAARAHLLLAYARASVAGETPPTYTGIEERQKLEQQARDAEERNRIRRIVSEGNYVESWRSFLDAYRLFLPQAEQAARELMAIADGPDPFDVFFAVDRVARNNGLHGLVASTRVEPEHVAGEMLRIIRLAHSRRGLDPEAEALPNDLLFYTCGKFENKVQVKGWHPLAPAFFRAWNSEDEEREAKQIMRAFRELNSEYGKWLSKHAALTTGEKDGKLRQLAEGLRLFDLVEAYGDDVEPDVGDGS